MSDCEPLREKKVNIEQAHWECYGDECCNPELIDEGDEHGEYIRTYDVASAVRFYKKYESDFQKFYEKYEDNCQDFLINVLCLEGDSFYYLDEEYIHNHEKERFNDWLFDYTFMDVME